MLQLGANLGTKLMHKDWIGDVANEAKKCVKERRYRITNHARQQQERRKITVPEIEFVLTNGFHEKDKTLFDSKLQTWKYAIRGKTIDAIELRIIIAFEENMAVITVIRFSNKGEKK